VTHGHTLCTVERFDAVAKAVKDCAFEITDFPVILSLEMHCSRRQQRQLTTMLLLHLGDALLSVRCAIHCDSSRTACSCAVADSHSSRVPQAEELVQTGRAPLLSPRELKRRVLCKGKVKYKRDKAAKSSGESSAPSTHSLCQQGPCRRDMPTIWGCSDSSRVAL
jgi:hypothetical protein